MITKEDMSGFDNKVGEHMFSDETYAQLSPKIDQAVKKINAFFNDAAKGSGSTLRQNLETAAKNNDKAAAVILELIDCTTETAARNPFSSHQIKFYLELANQSKMGKITIPGAGVSYHKSDDEEQFTEMAKNIFYTAAEGYKVLIREAAQYMPNKQVPNKYKLTF